MKLYTLRDIATTMRKLVRNVDLLAVNSLVAVMEYSSVPVC